MIVDLNDLGDGASLEADLCIIGAGAAGIAMTTEFLQTPYTVLLLEGGGLEGEPQSQALYDSEVVGYPHSGIHRGRARVFGGTTTLWAGQALPLDEIDFRCRPWVAHSGWPISRTELEPYYRRAEGVMGLERLDYGCSPLPTMQKLASDPSKFRTSTSQFSPQPNFAIAHGAELRRSNNVKVVFHANAIRIQAHEDGSRADGVEIGSLAGHRALVRAKYFVICCGAIETARLLLVSDNVHRNGLGNEFDLVGRYFQDHLQGPVEPMQGCGRELLDLPSAHYVGGIAQSPKLRLSEKLQESAGILNATVGVTYDVFPSEDSPIEAAKRLVRAVLNRRLGALQWADFRRAATAPGQIAAAGYRHYVKKEAVFRMGGTPHIGVQCECAPIPDSRVTLSSETDPLGIRRARLDWHLSPLVLKTVRTAVRVFGGELERLGMGKCDLDGLEAKTMEQVGLFDSNHHIGTARMSDNTREGVVNPDCRMHALNNVYVGSSAVFPTGGHSNPTLTILALAMRLSDHLKSRLAES